MAYEEGKNIRREIGLRWGLTEEQIGLEYPSYAECAKEAKKSIMQMIVPSGVAEKVGDM